MPWPFSANRNRDSSILLRISGLRLQFVLDYKTGADYFTGRYSHAKRLKDADSGKFGHFSQLV